MGAPSISDDKIIAALQSSRGLLYVAARSLGISPVTIYNRKAKNPKIQEAIANEREFTTDAAEGALYRAITNGEAWAVCFYLKTQGKNRGYVERQELTGKDGGPLEHTLAVSTVAVEAAERAFYRALLEPAALGGPEGDDHSPHPGTNGVSSLPLPSRLPDGPGAAPAGAQGPPDRL
jgi:hypothetical protein